MPLTPAARSASDGRAGSPSPAVRPSCLPLLPLSRPLSRPRSRSRSRPRSLLIQEPAPLPARPTVPADEKVPAPCISVFSTPTTSFRPPSDGCEELKSPPPLTKTAARVVVKAVRNTIYPPKDNPFVSPCYETSVYPTKDSTFVSQFSENFIYPIKENSFVRKISENSVYPTKDKSLLGDNPKDNMYPQTKNSLPREDPKNVEHPPLSAGGLALGEKDAVGYVLEEKPGNCFLKLVRAETLRLNGMVDLADKELSEQHHHHIPEEMQEKLRMASGQAKLLVKKKMQQFEGLCLKNINQEADDGYPTTDQDLAGFWDMVKLQIDQVDRQFSEIEYFRKSSWSASDSNEPEDVASNVEEPTGAAVAAAAVAVCQPSPPKQLQQTLPSAGKSKSGLGCRRNSWSEADWRVSCSKGSQHPTNTRPERLQSGKPTATSLHEQRKQNMSAKELEKDNSRSSSGVTEHRRGFMRFK